MTTPKTKRDRAAGRNHRHTAIQTIIDNHNQVRTELDSLDNSIAALQDETCGLGSRLDAWYDRLNQADKDNLANIAHTMSRVVETERKAAEVESAVGILQGASKTHGKALAQLDRYTKRLHTKQTNMNRELNLTSAAVDEVSDNLMWFGRLLLGLAASTTLGYTILFLLIIVK
ncbi:hypothetical protein [uncultured Rothia sp.]|uniref:hypothetical protein n=1 Tax=uncultured Rothia sp. TaxID=316088 RepID=UPI0025F930FD|nr:hypothetical protein [uncultured Rothia sp.]